MEKLSFSFDICFLDLISVLNTKKHILKAILYK